MKKLYHSLIVLAGIVAVLASCQKEPCQKCLEAQTLARTNEVEVTAALVGDNYIASGLTCPSVLYVWNEEGFIGRYDNNEGRFLLELPDGQYDFAVTVNVPELPETAMIDLRNSVLIFPEQEGLFLFGINKGVEVSSSDALTVALSRYSPNHSNINKF